MKKILLIITLLVPTALFAQSVKFGVSAGLNEATASVGETQTSIKWLAGFNAGAFAEVDFGKLSLRPGVFYSQKGYNSKTALSVNNQDGEEQGTFNATGKVRLNYLEIPVNILYNIPVKAGKVFLGGG